MIRDPTETEPEMPAAPNQDDPNQEEPKQRKRRKWLDNLPNGCQQTMGEN